ncbi:hypothetical protein K1719_026009 [Acacia pycnantha]|nr:hypothetical protein K1719_026009 [Acacia pycnantha]
MMRLKIPHGIARKLLSNLPPSESNAFRVDFRSTHVHYLNNLEEDAEYKRWRSNLNEILMPVFPGQMRYIRKNLFHAIYFLLCNIFLLMIVSGVTYICLSLILGLRQLKCLELSDTEVGSNGLHHISEIAGAGESALETGDIGGYTAGLRLSQSEANTTQCVDVMVDDIGVGRDGGVADVCVIFSEFTN